MLGYPDLQLFGLREKNSLWIVQYNLIQPKAPSPNWRTKKRNDSAGWLQT
jgi:hypothetical protein